MKEDIGTEPSHHRADSGIQGPNLRVRKEKELVLRVEDFPWDRQAGRGLWADARGSNGSMRPNFGCLGITTWSEKFAAGQRFTLFLLLPEVPAGSPLGT